MVLQIWANLFKIREEWHRHSTRRVLADKYFLNKTPPQDICPAGAKTRISTTAKEGEKGTPQEVRVDIPQDAAAYTDDEQHPHADQDRCNVHLLDTRR